MNSLNPLVNNSQNNNLNILQLFGLQQPQNNVSLGSFVTNDSMNPNTPTLQNSLYPSQFNLYGRPSYYKPSVAEELTAVGVKSLINFATPKWAQNTFRQDQKDISDQRYKDLNENVLEEINSNNNRRIRQRRNRYIKFQIDDKFKTLSINISGNENLAGYLQFIDNFDKSNFKDRNKNRLSNCEVLKLISPLDQKNENLQECLLMHMYANLITKKVCFIFSCRDQDKQIYFYQICSNISPLDLQVFNLDKKILVNRFFRKSADPNTFMISTQFSLDRSIDCTNSMDILKDISLINVLDKFSRNQLQFYQQWQSNYITYFQFFYFLCNQQEINFML